MNANALQRSLILSIRVSQLHEELYTMQRDPHTQLFKSNFNNISVLYNDISLSYTMQRDPHTKQLFKSNFNNPNINKHRVCH